MKKPNPVEVKIIDENANSMHEALGISAERAGELAIICAKAVQSSSRIVNCMYEISVQLTHPNELAMCMYSLSSIYRDMEEASNMMKLLRKIKNAIEDEK